MTQSEIQKMALWAVFSPAIVFALAWMLVGCWEFALWLVRKPTMLNKDQAGVKNERIDPLVELAKTLASWQGGGVRHHRYPGVSFEVIGGDVGNGGSVWLQLRSDGCENHDGHPIHAYVRANEVTREPGAACEVEARDEVMPVGFGQLAPKGRPIMPGDVVQLRSGGPQMTVCSLARHGEEARLTCCWHFMGMFMEKDFPEVALERVGRKPY